MMVADLVCVSVVAPDSNPAVVRGRASVSFVTVFHISIFLVQFRDPVISFLNLELRPVDDIIPLS